MIEAINPKRRREKGLAKLLGFRTKKAFLKARKRFNIKNKELKV